MKNKSVNTASFYYSLNMLKLLQDMNLVTEDEVAKIKKSKNLRKESSKMKITEITAEKKENKIQRLAAYCRVSSDSADQLHSFAAQLRYYSNYEKQHPEFELVGIYADEGLSGTSMKKRAEMNRLIQDCEQGKIDRVIVKSISRFARNTHDLLQTLRLLKSYGVTVFFEELTTEQRNVSDIPRYDRSARERVHIGEYALELQKADGVRRV